MTTVRDEGHSEDLLRRALIDETDAAAVALRVEPLALCDALTVIFHGRRDLGTIQTYIAHGGLGTGSAVGASELLRVPCDTDLAVWREPLQEACAAEVTVDHSIEIDVRLPAQRLMPVALVAPERQITVAPVCSARTL